MNDHVTGNSRPNSPSPPGCSLSRGQVRGQRHLGHCLRLRRGALPDLHQEPGRRDLLPGGQDRRHHLPPAGPPQEVLAPSTGLHHGRGGHHRRPLGRLLPGDSRQEAARDYGGRYQVS